MLTLILLAGCRRAAPGEAPIRRLTPTQYNTTIADLLGHETDWDWPELEEARFTVETAWPWNFPADIAVHGFEEMAEGQVSSDHLIEQHQAAASHFAMLTVEEPL